MTAVQGATRKEKKNYSRKKEKRPDTGAFACEKVGQDALMTLRGLEVNPPERKRRGKKREGGLPFCKDGGKTLKFSNEGGRKSLCSKFGHASLY